MSQSLLPSRRERRGGRPGKFCRAVFFDILINVLRDGPEGPATANVGRPCLPQFRVWGCPPCRRLTLKRAPQPPRASIAHRKCPNPTKSNLIAPNRRGAKVFARAHKHPAPSPLPSRVNRKSRMISSTESHLFKLIQGCLRLKKHGGGAAALGDCLRGAGVLLSLHATYG